ncbi:MAG: glutamate/tyrosine decarboxylase-like PLP-dependent enzyme [Paraglaciecola sp.]|jgi:glutamate/tyrosine decarboxylase-like PLP-dependent enzyme
MTTQKEFKAAAEKALEYAVAWREDGAKLPAFPSATTAEIRARFDGNLPDKGLNGEVVIEHLVKATQHGLVNNTHPNFYAWVQGASHPIGVAADILTSAWGQNAAIHQTAPAAAIAEEVSAKWILELLDLAPQCSFAFATGATTASFICLSVARSEVLHRQGYDLELEGLIGAPNIQIFLGEEAHATIISNLRYLGFGRKNLVFIAVDNQGRMLPDDLKHKLGLSDGPKIVILQAGHINSGAFDPFNDIIPLCKAHHAWVHVDGAFGLWARSTPLLAHLCEGVEHADSWTVDGHKWLQVPYDSGYAIVKHPDAHRRAMDISASYLVSDPNDGRNPTQFGMELSRRARGFSAWAVLQALGREGVVEMVSRHHECAKLLQQLLAGTQGIRILNEVVLNQLAIAFGDENEALEKRNQMTGAVIREIRQENKNFVLGASWKNQSILRISIISQLTDKGDIEDLAASVLRAWDAVRSA